MLHKNGIDIELSPKCFGVPSAHAAFQIEHHFANHHRAYFAAEWYSLENIEYALHSYGPKHRNSRDIHYEPVQSTTIPLGMIHTERIAVGFYRRGNRCRICRNWAKV